MKFVVDLVKCAKFFDGLAVVGIKEMGIRRQAREVALQLLYMIDFNDSWSNYTQDQCPELFDVEDKSRDFSNLIVDGVIQNRVKLDSVITRASENWSIQRMARVDRALLRLACFELCCLPEIPRNVAINEAIEVAKKFGSEDSPMFINGVLDKIASYIDKVREDDLGIEQPKKVSKVVA